MRVLPAVLLLAAVGALGAVRAEAAGPGIVVLSTSTPLVSASDGAAMWSTSPDGIPAHGEPDVSTTDVSLLDPGATAPRTIRLRTREYVRDQTIGSDARGAPVAFVFTNSATYRVAFDGTAGAVRVRDPSHGAFAMEHGRVARLVPGVHRDRVDVAPTLSGRGRTVLELPARWRVSSMALGRRDTVFLLVLGAARATREHAELWRVRRGRAPQVLATARDQGASSGVGEPVVSEQGTRASLARWSSSASGHGDVATFSVATGRPLVRRRVEPLGTATAEELVLDPHRSLVVPQSFDPTCGRPGAPSCVGLGLLVR